MNVFFKKLLKNTLSPLVVGAINILIAFSTLRGLNIYGIIIVLIGEIIYGVHNFIMGNVWSIKVESKKKLVKEAWFKYLRHPIYLGSIIALIGMAFTLMSFQSLIFTFLIIVPYFYFRAKLEEEMLSKTLKGYKQYMKKTGMFFPKF